MKEKDRYEEFLCRGCGASLKNSTTMRRKDTPYHICKTCGTAQCIYKDLKDLVTSNNASEDRNDDHQMEERFSRMEKYSGYAKLVMDYGCGNGQLAGYISSHGVPCFAIDTHNNSIIEHIPDGCICSISMVEVIEHLIDPEATIQTLSRLLRKGGTIYLETSTIDALLRFGEHDYIDPNIGHITILSQFALCKISENSSLDLEVINPTSFIMRKPSE